MCVNEVYMYLREVIITEVTDLDGRTLLHCFHGNKLALVVKESNFFNNVSENGQTTQ